MPIIKNIAGFLLDFASGLANVPAAVKALAGLKGSVGQIIEISGTDAEGVVSALTAANKPSGDGVTVPTKVSELTNDAGYQTESQVNALIAAVPTFKKQVVSELPDTGEDSTLYLVPFAADDGQYLEYLYVNGAWEVIGNGVGSGDDDDTGTGAAWTSAQINLLEDAFEHIQWADDTGPQYAAQLIASLRGGESGGEEPETPDTTKTLESISAEYTGGNVAVGTALSSLTGITVTAHYSDGSTAIVIGYSLSGTIAEGDNTITVTYMGKTATITVTAEAQSADGRTLLHNWVLSDAEGAEIDTVGGAEMVAYNKPTESADGWTIDGNYKAIYAADVIGPNRTVEWDVTTAATEMTHAWLFAFGTSGYSGSHVVANKNGVWGWENGSTYEIDKEIPELVGLDAFNGKTVALCFGADSYISLYLDGVFVSTSPWAVTAANAIVGRNTAAFNSVTVSACRVYEGVL